MRANAGRGQRQGGFILITAALIVAGLLTLTQVGMTRSLVDLSAANRFIAKQQAFHLAEAGIDRSLRELKKASGPFPSPWVSANSDTACGTPPCYRLIDGNLTVLVSDADGPLATVTSTGNTSTPQTLEVIAEIPQGRAFQQAVFGKTEVRLRGGFVDSYDSTLGAYTPAPAVGNRGQDGDVRTNSTATDMLRLEDVTVSGDVWVGAGGVASVVIEKIGAVSISGLQDSSPVNLSLPPVTIPSSLAHLGDLTLGGGENRVLPAGSYWYYNIVAEDGSTLTTSGAVTLYLSGGLDFRGDKIGGAGNVPANLSIRVSGGNNIDFRSTEFYGTVYAPEARVRFEDGGAMFGAVAAEEFRAENGSKLHYDKAAENLVAAGPSEVTVRLWRKFP